MPKNRDIVRKEPDEIERRRDSLVQRSVDYLKEFDEQGLANVEELDLEGWDLHRAARIPRARDIARALIARGDDVDALDDAKYTPLHWATYRNNIYVTQLLVDHGANINVKTPGTNSWNGWSPLRFAVTGPNRLAQAAIARLLILHGAEVDSRDVEGLTPLHATFNLKIAQVLIEHGADVHARTTPDAECDSCESDISLRTPLQMIIHRYIEENNELPDPDGMGVIRLLIDNGANTDGIDLNWMDDQKKPS